MRIIIDTDKEAIIVPDTYYQQIDKKNEILRLQDKLTDVKIQKVVDAKTQIANSVNERHERAKDAISDAMATIYHEDDREDNTEQLSDMANRLRKLLKWERSQYEKK